jgi:hypothetical protein
VLIFYYKDYYLQLAIQGGADPEALMRICGKSESIAALRYKLNLRESSFARRSKKYSVYRATRDAG